MTEPKRLVLHDLHVEMGARFGPFAGYEMPLHYTLGVMKEHEQCRTRAGLFDVSHMGQVRLSAGGWDAVARAFETLVPQDVLGLADGRQRYGFFTNANGGIEDDLMLARQGEDLLVVVNAACKDADFERMASLEAVQVEVLEDRALLALQGPLAGACLARLDPSVAATRFMDVMPVHVCGVDGWATRSGYTGEDGFEISVPVQGAEIVARTLLGMEEVAAIGLGARDSLRLEAGLCLYGSDIDAETTPAEAGLMWAIQKARKPGGARVGGFPGAEMALALGARSRVGLRPVGRAPMRGGVQLFDSETADLPVGAVTSGGFGPTVGGPISMGYVTSGADDTGRTLWGEVRGKRMPVHVVELPFVPARFKR